MITFIELGPKPTIHLLLRVPVSLPSGGWSWGELQRFAGVLAKEYAYTADEVRALVHTYGRMIARMICRSEADRFSIMARGPVTGRTLGIREWSLSHGEYEPAGEYLCGFRAAAKAYFETTGQLITSQRFDARSGPFLRADTPPVASAA